MRVFALALLLWGCGYRFVSGRAQLPQGVLAVEVPVFANRTSEPMVEGLFTQAARELLGRRGALASTGSDAARLEGELLDLSGAQPVANPNQGVAAYRLQATMRLTLRQESRVLASVDVLGTEEYLPGADPLFSEANRRAAVARMAKDMLRDGLERLAFF